MKPKTYAFDNQRVFVKRSQGGEESDFDGWAKITAKGRREFLAGIDSERCALIVIDRSKHDHSAWPDQISQCDRSLGDVLRQRTRDVVVPTTDQVVNDYPWDCWVDPTVKDPQVTRVESGWW